ncbi:MAG: hypothetical protein WDW36_006902 [Sanguina aurantia]
MYCTHVELGGDPQAHYVIPPVYLPLLEATFSWPDTNAFNTEAKKVLAKTAAHNLSIFRSQVLSRTVHQFTSPKLFDQAKKLARFNTFPLTVSCPPGREVKLLGTGEGVKYACDISELEKPCLIYSFGSEGDYAFEIHVLSITKCEVHTFDCTYKGEDLGPRHHYHEWCLGSEPDASMQGRGKFMTYKDIVVELGHVGMEVEVLKIDIEGYEFQTMSYAIFYRCDNFVDNIGCCSEFSLLRVEESHTHVS